MRQHVYQVCHTRYQVLFYLREIGPVLKHCKSSKILWPGLYVVLNQWVNYVLFQHILTSVVHGCPVKQMNPKILQTLLPKNLCWSSLLTSCKSKACNCINIENSAQVFFSNSFFFSKFLRTAFYRTTVNGCFWSLSIVMEKYTLEINN